MSCLRSWTDIEIIGRAGYPTNFAEFTVEPGEVVNGGEIVFSGSFADRTVEVRDLPAGSLEKLAKRYPSLVAHMKQKYVSVDSLRTNQSETLGLQAARTPAPKTSTYYYYTGPVRR